MKIVIIIIIGLFTLYYIPFGLYLVAKTRGIKVSIFDLIRLQLKKIPTPILIDYEKRLSENAMNVEFKKLVNCYTEGIDLENVVSGLIKAKKNNLLLSFDKACQADTNNIDIERTVLNTMTNVGKKK